MTCRACLVLTLAAALWGCDTPKPPTVDAPNSAGLAPASAQPAADAPPQAPVIAQAPGNSGGPPPSPERIKAAEEGCNAGSLDVCVQLGDMIFDAGDRDPVLGVAAYRKACQGGQAEGCERLKMIARVGPDGVPEGVGIEPAEGAGAVLVQLAEACEKGEVASCNDLGLIIVRAPPEQRDSLRAERLFQKACDSAYTEGCNNLGYMYELGDGVTRDHTKALQLYTTSCDNDNVEGCSKLGFLLISGDKELRNFDRAEPILKKACDADSLQGCTNLGILMASRPGSEGNARVHLEKACKGGYPRGCTIMGLMHYHGDGVEKSFEEAAKLFEGACLQNHSGGCAELGELYLKGEGVEADPAKAMTFFDRACQMGSPRGCKRLEDVRSGKPVEDPAP